MSIAACRMVAFRTIADPAGNLTVIEGAQSIPFQIARVYYVHGVPPGAHRGGHAHKALQQVIVAVAGSFDVVLDDGRDSARVRLGRPEAGLLIVPMIWRHIENFSPGAVCLVLASEPYDEADYHRDYEEFVRARRAA